MMKMSRSRRLRRVVLRSAAGLEILHRDIKPSSILIADDGRPLLTDFGLARRCCSDALTEARALVGTFQYIPPEAWRGARLDTDFSTGLAGPVGRALVARAAMGVARQGGVWALALFDRVLRTPWSVRLPPVDLLAVGQAYYVRDGHHRISVARALGEEFIEASVTVW